MRSSSRSRLGLFLVLLLVFTAGLGLYTSLRGVARAAGPRIWLSQKVGPPTSSVQVHVNGFGHREPVLVDFDTTLVGMATTDATGKLVVRVTVPKAALPGMHKVQATSQSSGLKASATFLVQTDWAQIGFGPHHTGYNPYENVLSSSNVSALTLDWSYSTSSTSPAIANGVVYIGSDKLYALDAVTGALKWSYTTGQGISSSPALANGVVYFGAGYPTYALYALDAVTGALKWSHSMITDDKFSFSSSPAVANGVVYIGSDKLYALDAVTGTLKWSSAVVAWDISPVVANGAVYAGSCTNLVALDAMTGTFKWSSATGSVANCETDFFPPPAVANGVVYANSDKLYALDAVTGALKWSYTTGHTFASSSPAVANGVVYVGSGDGKLHALDALTGALKWSYAKGGGIGDYPFSFQAVANGVVYVGSADFNVYAFHLPSMS